VCGFWTENLLKRGSKMTVYTENGYKSRANYLRCMSEDYGVPLQTVLALADMLGENEDFDGLVIALEDYP
jgi:hypothetical protein